MHLYGLHCAPYHVALLIPLLNPFGADHEQVREVKDIAHLQQVHSLNQDQLLTKEKKKQSHVLTQTHNQKMGKVNTRECPPCCKDAKSA